MIGTRTGKIRNSTSEMNWASTLRRLAIILTVTGCASAQSPDQAAVEIKGSNPTAPLTTTAEAPANTALIDTAPDARGIVAYDGYEAAVARSGDTVAVVAQRIGLSASELGAYNGLSPTHPLRAGDELVLPPRPGGYAAPDVTTASSAPQTIPPISQGSSTLAPTDSTTTPIVAAPLQAEPTAVGEISQPAADGSAVWSPDIAAAAINRAGGFDEQGNLAAPPSAEEPLPPSPQAPGVLASPQLRQYQTPVTDTVTATAPVLAPTPAPVAAPAILPPTPPQPRPAETVTVPDTQVVESVAPVEPPVEPAVELAVVTPEPTTPPKPNLALSSELSLIRPVVGPVIIGFKQGAGRTRNDGIDFASPSGATVIAAASGEVALVSQSLGGLGTIVLIRHLGGEYLTVYGRIEKVTVKKGDIIAQGQRIGVVSPSTQPRMHFEVRRGAESLDPEQYF